MTWARVIVLVSLFHAWATLSENPDYKNCSRLKISFDTFIKTNGYFFPDPTLKTMYKYDKFINYTVFKHDYKNRVIFFMGEPYYWVIGKAEYLFVGHFWYQNRKPQLSGPWYTNFGPNNVSVTCEEVPEKPKISDSAGNSHPKLMFFLS